MKTFGVLLNFFLFFAFAIYFKMIISKTGQNKKKESEIYIQEERNSIFSRRHEIDKDLFIKPDMNKFPIIEYSEQIPVKLKSAYDNQVNVIKKSKNKMLNLRNTSNLELKKRFGYANLESVSDYEQNFQDFIFAVFHWAVALNKSGFIDDAITALEALVDFGSNYSKSFILLSDLYLEKKEKQKLKDLLQKLSSLDDVIKNRVINHINSNLAQGESI